jgi:hypothetical protein
VHSFEAFRLETLRGGRAARTLACKPLSYAQHRRHARYGPAMAPGSVPASALPVPEPHRNQRARDSRARQSSRAAATARADANNAGCLRFGSPRRFPVLARRIEETPLQTIAKRKRKHSHALGPEPRAISVVQWPVIQRGEPAFVRQVQIRQLPVCLEQYFQRRFAEKLRDPLADRFPGLCLPQISSVDGGGRGQGCKSKCPDTHFATEQS